MTTDSGFFERLATSIPAFRPILDSHVSEYGALLSHVLMGDFTRLVIDLFRRRRGGSCQDDYFRLALHLIDEGFSSSENLKEIVVVSFLENLHQAGDDYEAMRAYLTRPLLEALDQVEKDM